MRCKIRGPFSKRHYNRLYEAGYAWHCIDNGQLCFHKNLGDAPFKFPRFHVLIKPFDDHYELSVHLDQYSLNHKSNHRDPMAYQGTRVRDEFRQLIDHLVKKESLPTVNRPNLHFVPTHIREKKTVKKNGNGRPWKWKPIVRL